MVKSWSRRIQLNAAAAAALLLHISTKPTRALHVGQEICVSGFITCLECNVGRMSAYNTAYNVFQSISDPQDHNLQCLVENESCVGDGYEIVTKYSIRSEDNLDDTNQVYCRSFQLDSNSSSFIAAAGLGKFEIDSSVKVGGIPVSFAGQVTDLGDTLTSLATVTLDTETLSLTVGGCARETVPNHCIISRPGSFQYNPAPSLTAVSMTSSPSKKPAASSTQNPSSHFIEAVSETTSPVSSNQVSTTSSTTTLQSIDSATFSTANSPPITVSQLSNPFSPSDTSNTVTASTFISLSGFMSIPTGPTTSSVTEFQSIDSVASSTTISSTVNAAQLSKPFSPSGTSSTSISSTFISLSGFMSVSTDPTTSSATNLQSIDSVASSTTTPSTTNAAQLSKPFSPSGSPSTSTSPTFISLGSFMAISAAPTTSSPKTNLQSIDSVASSSSTSSTENASQLSKPFSPSDAPSTSTSPTFITHGGAMEIPTAPTTNSTNATSSYKSFNRSSNEDTISDDRIVIAMSASSEEEMKKLFRYHGQLAGASWGILLPLAMAAAWFRELLPVGKGYGGNSCSRGLCNQLWLTIHVSLTVVAAVLTSAAVYFVVKALSMEGGYEYAAKFSGSHQTMGLFLLIGVWIQVLGGILRPKIKHTDHVKMPLGASDEENRRDDGYIDSGDDSYTTDSTSSVIPGVVTHKWTISVHDDASTVGEQEEELEIELGDPRKSKARQVWDYGHRILAVTLLICGFWQLFSGLEAYQERFGDDTYLVTACLIWVGVFWTIVLVLTCFFKKF